MSSTASATDRPLLGILLMFGFCLLAPLGDSLAKILGPMLPLGMLLMVRFAIQPLILWPFVRLGGVSLRYPARVMWLIFLRTLLHIAGIGCMFTALRYMPLADTVAIAFVMPFIVLLLGHLWLGEEVGPHRMGAAAVGFAGTLMVIQPNFAEVGAPALLPLVVAVVFALFMLVTRTIAKEIDATALQTVSGVMATVVLGLTMGLAALIWSDPPELMQLARPGRETLVLLALMGGVGTVAHLLMTWSLRFAPSATLAPMQYLEIPIATVFGWAIFGDLPNGLAAFGIAVTVAAGLYVIHRERATAGRQAAPSPAGPAPRPEG